MKPFVVKRKMEFSDTDMAGIVHFSRFFIFMETAEHLFLKSLGIEIEMEVEEQLIGWPRAAASCQYLKPAKYGDELDIQVQLLNKDSKSITYGFLFKKGDTDIARGQVTSVCCVVDRGVGLEAVTIPQSIAKKLEQASE